MTSDSFSFLLSLEVRYSLFDIGYSANSFPSFVSPQQFQATQTAAVFSEAR